MIKLATPIRIGLVAVLVAAIAAGFALVPAGARLPVHWGIDGQADGFMPREWALLLPAVALLIVGGLLLAIHRLMRPEQQEAAAAMVGATFTALTGLFAAIAIGTVAIGTGMAVSMPQIIAMALAVMLLVLGNAMPKSRPNAIAGLRIPTTLDNPANWQSTHQVTGWMAVAGGVVLAAAALLAPPAQLIWWIAGCILVPLLAGATYSLLIARRGV